MKSCTQCNAENENDAQFCIRCGKSFKENDISNNPKRITRLSSQNTNTVKYIPKYTWYISIVVLSIVPYIYLNGVVQFFAMFAIGWWVAGKEINI